jgi:uncharacterized membrane protein YedE/YeeE
LIGLAGALLLLAHGRVAGISSIFAGLIELRGGDFGWRALFIGGLVAAGVVARLAAPDAAAMTLDRSLPILAVAGILIGIGTQLGGGCTSGHGVCGIGRLSRRSIVATLTFIATGALTAFVVMHVLEAGA